MTEPVSAIPLDVDQARALEMSNLTEPDDTDAFGLDETDLSSLSEHLRDGSPRRNRNHAERGSLRQQTGLQRA